MKLPKKLLSMILMILALGILNVSAQVDERKKSLITKNDGTEYIGVILQQDAREVLLLTDDIGEIFIPKHEISSIKELTDKDYQHGKYLGDNIFTTRYFLTTNGLPMKKGDSYAMIQLFGAEYQVAVANNFTIGGLTSWVGVPIIGSAKYSIEISEKVSAGLGVLAGTGSWAAWDSYGILPYGVITLGNNRANINLSAGYLNIGSAGNSTSAPLFSVAGLARLSDRVSFVGDSFIYAKNDVVAVIVPGLRFDRKNGGAFQFGFGGIVFNGELIPAPIPIVAWFVQI